MSEKVAIGSDHAGFEAKQMIKEVLEQEGIEWQDFGTFSKDSCDYPDFARKVAEEISNGNYKRGILCCGSGIGVSMVANKVRGVRAALCHDETTASLSRQHNDANILCLGERTTPQQLIPEIVKAWLSASFEGGRHERRVEKFEKPRADDKTLS